MSESKGHILARGLKKVFSGLLQILLVIISGMLKVISVIAQRISEWFETIAHKS